MRFKMEPIHRGKHFVFPPWILVEIMSQPEFGTARPFQAPAMFDVQLTELSTRMTSHFRSPSSFKHHYKLLNTHGHKADEPDEDDVGALDEAERKRDICMHNMCLLFWLVSCSFCVVRYYCFACMYEFEKVAMFENFVHGDFPVPEEKRRHLLLKCGMTDGALFRLVKDFTTHTTEGSMVVAQMAQDHTGVEVPDGLGHAGHLLANLTQQAVNHSAHHVNGLLRHEHTQHLAQHLENLTQKARDVDSQDVADRLAGASHHVLHHGSNLMHGIAGAAGDLANSLGRRLEAPAERLVPRAERAQSEEELVELRKCTPDLSLILATCEELPFGEPLPTSQIPVFGLFSIPVKCVHGSACQVSMRFEEYDFPFACFLVAWIVMFIGSRHVFHRRIASLTGED